MRIWLPSIVGLLVAACVAREQPVNQPAQARFEADWTAARDWREAVAKWTAQVQPRGAYPHTSAVFGTEHADKPGLHLGELPGVQNANWREREVLGVRYRLAVPLLSDGKFEPLALPESSYAWRIPLNSSFTGDVTVTVTADGALQARTPDFSHLASARVVFRIGREPTPTSLYQHGSEILIAAWGVALEPVSIELTDADGAVHWVFIEESGPE